jgi:hypothetical protein
MAAKVAPIVGDVEEDAESAPANAKAAFYRENAKVMTKMAAETPLPSVSEKYAAAAEQWTALAEAQERLLQRPS